MNKPESYPFLRIARQYGVDYSVVLKVANDLKTTSRANWLDFPDGTDPVIMMDIGHATGIQQSIRDGVIDWQTGERIAFADLDKDYRQRSHAPEDEPLAFC